MANVTQLVAQQSAEDRNKTTGYEVCVLDQGGSIVVSWVPVASAGYDNGTVTVGLPDSLFEVDGLPNTAYYIGLRAVNAGGPGSMATSQAVAIEWEPIALTGVIAR